MHIAIRVDASVQIGTGHLARCLTLANALSKKGATVRFITRSITDQLAAAVRQSGHEITILEGQVESSDTDTVPHSSWLGTSQRSDASQCRTALAKSIWDWVIVDHYALDHVWESLVRSCCRKLFAIDDLADRVHDCDVLLDQNYYRLATSRYAGKVPHTCLLLLGPKFALLREEFGRLRGRRSSKRNGIRRVLVFFGGIDSRNFTQPAIQALVSMVGKHHQVDVVIGAHHPAREDIKNTCVHYGLDCHVQTDHMAELMEEADIAIGAGGSANLERCCLGLPAIIFSVAPNQYESSVDLASYGAVYLASGGSVQEQITIALNELDHPIRLSEMSERASTLVDGLGTGRVCTVLLEDSEQ